MPSHYNDDEYKGSEHASDVFKAPTPELTEEQKKQKRDMERGRYLENPEQEDLSQQVNYSTMEENYARERRPGFDREMEAIGKADRAGNLTDQERIEAHKRAKRIRDAEDEIDPQTGWPMYLLKGAGWLLNKAGEGFDWVDKQAGIPGTDIDVYHARRKILDPLSETHFALGILGEILLPDSIDIATAGFSYIPNRFRKAGKAGIKLWADITKARKGAEFKAAKVDWDKGLEFAAKAEGRPYEKFLNEEGIVHAIKVDPDDIPKVTNLPPKGMSYNNDKLFKDLGFEDWEKYFVGAWEDLADPIGRNFSAAVSNDKYSINTFNRVRRETLPLVMEEYAGIADIKWPRRGPELHHINAIKATMPLFEGLARNERKELLKVLMREGIYAGHDPNNLMQLPHAVHKSVTKLWNDKIGKSGKLFFERDTDGLFKAAQLPFEERKLLAKNYAKVVKDLELTTLKMLKDYKVISKDGLARKLDKELKKQFNIANFENYILTGKYLGDEVSPEIKEIFKSRSVKNIRKKSRKKIDE